METFVKVLFIAAGGAVGSVGRYLINISPLARVFENFPFPTFFINVTGSFLIGFLLILLTDKFNVGDNVRMMIIVGFLGAFTTFSTFEMEIYALAKDGEALLAIAYLSLSVLVGFTALVAGAALGRAM